MRAARVLDRAERCRRSAFHQLRDGQPDDSHAVESAASLGGAETLEACMASSITQAREGTLYLMCGGKYEVFRASASDPRRPRHQRCGTSVEAGEAAKVKALVNMVMNINTAGLAEGLGLGAALKLDLTMLREIFAETGPIRGCFRRMAKTCRTVRTSAISPPRTPRKIPGSR